MVFVRKPIILRQKQLSMYEATLEYARARDAADPLRKWREAFIFPQRQGQPVRYFCGNSLGLQPRAVAQALQEELEQWATYGVEGHVEGKRPWMYYHHFLQKQSAALVGALEEEVVVMNTLSTNLHLLMVSFYQPNAQRFKVIMEAGAFPSDQYAVETQVRFHGFDPETAIVELRPREGEHSLRDEDILRTIEQEGPQTALILIGGVNYYTGQFFDLESITRAGHAQGAKVGFDLAHTAGNLPLRLHEWGTDFAAWCSYKYLNSGPGGPSGVFVHQRHAMSPDLPRFAGWWGHDEASRFDMKKGFIPMRGAAGWQLSNVQILSTAAHRVSLDVFEEVGMEALRTKSVELTGYLEFMLDGLRDEGAEFQCITPREPGRRGAQLSLLTGANGKKLFDFLTSNGVIADWRQPNVIRLAPAPLYNSFEDVWHLADLMRRGAKS